MEKRYRNYSHLNLAEETGQYRRSHVAGKKKKSSFWSVLLKYVLPFILINLIIFFVVTSRPDFTVNVEENGDYQTADLTVAIKTRYPKKDFSVTLAGNPVEMKQIDKRTYTAVLNGNGTLEVSLTNLNGMNKTVYENINCMDDDPPIITEGDSAMGIVSMYVEDTQSGVNFESIYARDGMGRIIKPDMDLSSEEEGFVTFYFDAAPLEVHVLDNSGRESVATFAVSSESDDSSQGPEIVIQ